MRLVTDAVFYVAIGALFTHELDAVPNHEWRGMPFLQSLPDELGMLVFVVAHVPLFAVLIGLVASVNRRTRRLSRIGIAAFLPIHGLLHVISMSRPTYEFSSTLSNALIFGAGLLGALYLTLEFGDRLAHRRRVVGAPKSPAV
jgi:predicted permease